MTNPRPRRLMLLLTPSILRNRLTLGATVALAHLAAAEPALLSDARQAIAERVPEAAIVKLQAAFSDPSLGKDDQKTATLLLAEAQLNAGRKAAALETISQFEDSKDPRAKQLRALTLASLGRWSEALGLFRELAATGAPDPVALTGEAESLQALGRTAEAVAILERLARTPAAQPVTKLRLATLLIELGRTSEARAILAEVPPQTEFTSPWRLYAEARIRLIEKRPADALDALSPLLGSDVENPRPAGVSESLFAAAKLAEAEARLALNGPEAAENLLKAFLRQNPDSPHLELVFRRLDQVCRLEQNPDEGSLLGLAGDLPPRGEALARFYVCRLQLHAKRYDRAAASLRSFLDRFPDHAMTPYAHAMLADAALAQGDLAGAESALDAASRTAATDELRGQFALKTALVNLAQNEFVRASTGFSNAARLAPSLKHNATYDAALAWLRQGNYERFAEERKAFAASSPGPLLDGNLQLEEGLARARSADSGARRTLAAFIEAFPAHPRQAEAHIALAELALNDGNIAEAEKLAVAATAAPVPTEMLEQAEYLAVFAEDAKVPRDEERVIEQARSFIARHASSPLLGEVRMKLGETYFRRGDYLKAEEQFETLASEQPAGPHAGPALFLAGQSAMRLLNADALKRALELFGKLADKHGPLEQHARLHQAIIKNRLSAPDDAVRIYESILSAQPPVERELRLAALTGKGDNLVALGTTDRKHLDAAIAAYDEVAAVPEAGPEWKNQAAYRKAKVLQQLEKTDEAFTVLYDIVNRAAAGPRETFWFSKAGFDAAGIAETRRQWKSAVAIYDKMAAIPGPHTEQARQRAKTLRLEHFLWD